MPSESFKGSEIWHGIFGGFNFWSRHSFGFCGSTRDFLEFRFFAPFKVARYSFLEWIPPTFERKLRRHKQRFGQINTTVVLDKDENLLWSGLQWHRSCHSNEMTPLPILHAAVFLSTGNCSSKIVYWSFFLQ